MRERENKGSCRGSDSKMKNCLQKYEPKREEKTAPLSDCITHPEAKQYQGNFSSNLNCPLVPFFMKQIESQSTGLEKRSQIRTGTQMIRGERRRGAAPFRFKLFFRRIDVREKKREFTPLIRTNSETTERTNKTAWSLSVSVMTSYQKVTGSDRFVLFDCRIIMKGQKPPVVWRK